MKTEKQPNYCVSLLRRTKSKHYNNLDEKGTTDKKRTVKPFLSDKTPFNAKITLIEDGEIISSDNEIADLLNTFFSNIVSNLNLPESLLFQSSQILIIIKSSVVCTA